MPFFSNSSDEYPQIPLLLSSEQKQLLLEEALDFLEYTREKLIELESNLQNNELLSLIHRCIHRILDVSEQLEMSSSLPVLEKTEKLFAHLVDGKHALFREDMSWIYQALELLQEQFVLLQPDAISPFQNNQEEISNWNGKITHWLEEQIELIQAKNPIRGKSLPHKLGELLDAKGFADSFLQEWAPEEETTSFRVKQTPLYFGHTVHEEYKIAEKKLDQIQGIAGDLEASYQRMLLHAQTHPNLLLEAKEVLAQMESLLLRLRPEIQSISSIPVEHLFSKLERMGKEFKRRFKRDNFSLQFSNQGCFVAKHHTQVIIDILVPLLRNAVEHGIETQEERHKKNKPAMGNIHIKAFHEDCFLVFEVQDDGKGLNKKLIQDEALRQNMIHEEEEMDDALVSELFFARQLPVHARNSLHGFGLAKITRRLQDLQGSITYVEHQKEGCSFLVYIPLPPSFRKGTLFQLEHEFYFLPSSSMIKVLPESEIHQQQKGNHTFFFDKDEPNFLFLKVNSQFPSSLLPSKKADLEHKEQKKYYLFVFHPFQNKGVVVETNHFETHVLVEQTFSGSSFLDSPLISGGGWDAKQQLVWILNIEELFQLFTYEEQPKNET